ncbi:hypothetical protein PQ455_18800 [Sphingomonas naphthae]|uniref:VanZ-like domain-containing protein n=1 Tax=Sphingomonas naphthae TaxID=1813468 RepID=A0ABY7TMK1_9SPHN|nr:hypothetical protein [Sphingomonas naphthae]WCT73630.1 hypothetical protein PQ455_18800 [Sphingomonas naphthae]
MDALVKAYHYAGQVIVTWTGQSDKFVHVHTGLLLWLLAALVLRKPLRSIWPFAIVALAEFVNELLDYVFYSAIDQGDTVADVVATLAWPLVLMLALNMNRRLRG